MIAPAGWYPDPDRSPQLRYWDGAQWTGWYHPPVEVPAAPLAADLAALAVRGRRAKLALLAMVPVQALAAVGFVLVLRSMGGMLADMWDDIGALEPGAQYEPDPAKYASFYRQGMVANLAGLPMLVIGLLVVLWFHQAAQNAERMGRRARWSPVWAIVGWLVPIANLFIPYQLARDLFAVGHPGRRLVAITWALYLGGGAANLALFGVAAAVGGPEATVAAVAVAASITLVTAVAARAVIDAVERDQQAGAMVPG